jgi:hypothetical protein
VRLRIWGLAFERSPEGRQTRPRELRRGIQKSFAARVAEVRTGVAPGTSVEVWFQDEMRVGQKNKLTYRWARRARGRGRPMIDAQSRPTCSGRSAPERGTGAALVLPACNMQLHLDEIATQVAPGAHAILILDQAGWHGAHAAATVGEMLAGIPSSFARAQQPRESASSSARTGSPIETSNRSTTSSNTVATLGTRSSINHGRSCPSRNATGPQSVSGLV